MDKEIDGYLSKLPPAAREICEQLRKAVLANMPGVNEIVAHGALGYGPTASAFDRVVYIAPQKSWVNLGFFFGSDIPDPGKLLVGTGVRMQHIKIKSKNEADNPAIARILQSAWAKTPMDMEKIHKRKK